jgi:O-antigen/teichoic acid export membrane protein
LRTIESAGTDAPAPAAAPPAVDAIPPRSDGEIRSLARGGSLTLFGAGASGLLGLVLVLVVGRGLHAQGTGLLFEAIALFSIFNNPIGADTGAVRFVSISRARDRAAEVAGMMVVAVVPTLVIGVVIAALVYVFAAPLAHVFFQGTRSAESVTYIRALVPFLPLALGMTVALAGTRALGSMVPFVSIQNVAVPAVRPVAVLAVILAGMGALAVALSWAIPLAGGFVAAVVVLVLLVRRTEARELCLSAPARCLRTLAREFWAFSAPQGVASFFQVTLLWLDILLVGAYATTRDAGVYSVSSRYVLAGAYALQAVGLAIGPQVSRLLARHQNDKVQDVFQAATWWLIAASWPVYLVMAVFSPLLLRPFGHDFHSGATSLTILSLAMLVLIATGANRVVLLMSGASSWNLAIAGLQLALDLGLNIVLIPRFGINGAAVAWAVSIVVGNVLINVILWIRLRINPFGAGFPLVTGASALLFGGLGLVFRAVLGPSLPSCLAFLALAGALYAVFLWRSRDLLQLDAFRGMVRDRLRQPALGEVGA